jgi:precorrin-2/cobalt-factor-2 C20-methyltransferase
MNKAQPKIGRFYGIGLGPGDPELLTLKACNVLSRVDKIFVPQKSDESESFARSIIPTQVKEADQRTVSLIFPMVRSEAQLEPYWQKAAQSIWEEIEKGHDCAFVNVGDPLLYGTFIHLLRTLQKLHPQIEVEVVPGISSLNGAAAATIFPLAVNNERMAIISAEKDEAFIRETLKNFDTVVVLKVNSIFHKLLDILEEVNLVDHCVLVRRCSTGQQEIISDIRTLKDRKLDYFSILLIRREAW